jgi:Flp pilus assembly pilin Flp
MAARRGALKAFQWPWPFHRNLRWWCQASLKPFITNLLGVKFLNCERGATLIEYALLLSLIGTVALIGFEAVGGSLQGLFGSVSGALGPAPGPPSPPMQPPG